MKNVRYLFLCAFLSALSFLSNFQTGLAAENDFGFTPSFDSKRNLVSFEWLLPGSQNDILIEVYCHDGTVYINDNFKLYKTYDADTLAKKIIGEYVIYRDSFKLDFSHSRSYYTKVIYTDGGVKTSKVSFITLNGKYWDPVTFKTTPTLKGKIGQKYEYDADAESSNKLPVHFTLGGPNDATIDEATGKISWTPKKSGSYLFILDGWTHDLVKKYEGAQQRWHVIVPRCAEPSSVSGQVTDKDGKLYGNGYALISTRLDVGAFSQKCDLVDGKYLFAELDSSYYKLQIFTYNPGGKDKEEGHRYFNITCGEAKQLDIQLKPPNTNNRISFSTVPPNRIVLGNEYVYKAKASAKNANLKIKYSIITEPAGATIDENTGEFRWTPDSLGHYGFNIAATAVENEYYDSLNASQYIHFEVGNCENPGKLKVTVNVHPDVVFRIWDLALYKKMPVNSEYPDIPPSEVAQQVEDSVWEFKNLDSGTYYLYAESVAYVMDSDVHNLNGYWYEADVTGKNATPIRIECGSDQELNLNVLPLAPYYYHISGRATADDGKPIKNAAIVLHHRDGDFLDAPFLWHGVSAWIETDSNGYYGFYAPTKHNFIVSAEIDSNSTPNQYAYSRLYYPQSPSPNQAKIFELNSPQENIDFVFPTHEKYNNSVSGKIIYEGSAYRTTTEVVLYYVEPIDKFKEWKYMPFYGTIDDKGNYEVRNLAPGKYIAFATPALFYQEDNLPAYYREDGSTADNWIEASRIVVAENSQITGINIELPKRKGVYGNIVLRGYIYETKKKQILKGMDELPEDTLRLPGANIYPINENWERQSFATTDGEGKFTLYRISPDIKTLKIDKVGYDIKYIDIKDAGQPGDIQLKLLPKGIYERPKLAFCRVSPNPAAETLRLDFQADGATRITLVNSLGEKVYSSELGPLSGASTHSIELGSLPQGAYYVIVESGAGIFMTPISVVK